MTGPDTREKLLSAAMRLFHEQGYAATGVATILRDAGVQSGSLYHIFPSKEALLVAVLERYQSLLHPELIAPVEAATADPIERVFALLDNYRQMLVITGCGLGCPIGNLALEVSDTYPGVRDKIAANFTGWCAVVQEWLEAAGDRLPPDLDRGQLSRFILTVMEGGLMQARAHRSLAPYEASVAQLRDYVNRLLAEAAR